MKMKYATKKRLVNALQLLDIAISKEQTIRLNVSEEEDVFIILSEFGQLNDMFALNVNTLKEANIICDKHNERKIKNKCECKKKGIFAIHKPNECKCTNNLKTYYSDEKVIWLCSNCAMNEKEDKK